MDLSTTYMGLKLNNPLVPSASPLSREIGNIREMEDAGASAVVLYSLFEEQLKHDALELDHFLSRDSDSYAEALSYFPNMGEYNLGPEAYLEHVAAANKAVDIPVIASLNGHTAGGWVDFASKLEQAGADAIELNIYSVAADPKLTGSQVEQRYIDIVSAVKSKVSIPVAVKLSPSFSAFANMATRLDEAGADGLVLFNRFYQPDIDLAELEVKPSVTLSSSVSARLPMRWIAILCGRIRASLAASGGVHTRQDILKLLMVGADITTMTSVLLEKGVGHLTELKEGLLRWMEEHEYESVEQLKGSLSHRSCPHPGAFERANYMKVLASYGSSHGH